MSDNSIISAMVEFATERGFELTPENSVNLFAFIRQLAEEGDAKALFFCGILALSATDDASEERNGMELLQKSAELGCPEAAAFLAHMAEEQAPDEIDPELLAAAEGGNASAQLTLGVSLIVGDGVAKDAPAGFAWLQKAADQELVEAMATLAVCYQNGTAVDQDLEMAIVWFEKAAEIGSADVRYDLGKLYLDHFFDHAERYERGMYWLNRAAEGGHEAAAKYYAFNRYVETAVADGRISADTPMVERLKYVFAQAQAGDEAAAKCFGLDYNQEPSAPQE